MAGIHCRWVLLVHATRWWLATWAAADLKPACIPPSCMVLWDQLVMLPAPLPLHRTAPQAIYARSVTGRGVPCDVMRCLMRCLTRRQAGGDAAGGRATAAERLGLRGGGRRRRKERRPQVASRCTHACTPTMHARIVAHAHPSCMHCCAHSLLRACMYVYVPECDWLSPVACMAVGRQHTAPRASACLKQAPQLFSITGLAAGPSVLTGEFPSSSKSSST